MSEDRRGKRGARSRNADRSEDEKAPRLGGTSGSSGGGIFKSAAVAVLRQHRKLMTTGDITRFAVEMGLLKCQGKTPEATMASALYTDVKRKLQKSLFTRPQEGLFGLREWLDEGYYPEGWVGPPDGLGLAPFKRRNALGGQQGSVSPGGKAGRQVVRTGPGRSSKSKASRSWRTAASDAEEDEDIPLDDDDDDDLPLTGRSVPGSATAAGPRDSTFAPGGDDEYDDEAMGEAEEAEEEGEDGGEDAAEGAADGQEDGRQGSGEAGAGAEAGGTKEATSSMGAARAQQPSPGFGIGRRKGRHSTGTDAADGAVPQDECLSPLHMLGEAAVSESLGDLGGATDLTGPPPAKRKRPSSITVPDRAGGLGGAEGVTPKSPYEDSLAALHEIATSPSTFELTSARERDRERERDAAGGGLARGGSESGGKGGRARPRLQVDVPGQGMELGMGPGSRRDGGTPGTALLTDNPMMQGETTPAILLQASPVTTASGQPAMMLRQAPVLVTLPPALASPSAAAAGALDTPALLHVQLPGGAPSELMQTTLITPSAAGPLSPFRAQAAAARGGLLKADGGPVANRPPNRRVSFSGQVGILGPPPATGAPSRQPLQPPALGAGASAAAGGTADQAGGAAGSAGWPPRLTPAQVESELVEVTRMRTVVERLESKLGNSHPQVGKAWLAVARMYQHLGESERNNGVCCKGSMAKAAESLKRAMAVCRACAESCGAEVQCEEAFRYLTARNSGEASGAEAPLPTKGSGGEQGVAGQGDQPAAQDAAAAQAQGDAPTGAAAQGDVVMTEAGGDNDAVGQLGADVAAAGAAAVVAADRPGHGDAAGGEDKAGLQLIEVTTT